MIYPEWLPRGLIVIVFDTLAGNYLAKPIRKVFKRNK